VLDFRTKLNSKLFTSFLSSKEAKDRAISALDINLVAFVDNLWVASKILQIFIRLCWRIVFIGFLACWFSMFELCTGYVTTTVVPCMSGLAQRRCCYCTHQNKRSRNHFRSVIHFWFDPYWFQC